MALIALISAKGSPGVTTTSLAMALAWPRPVMLVEADPSGGDILAGYLRGQLALDRGLVQVAVAARQHRIADDFNAQLLDIAKPKSPVSRVLLSGLADPAQAATVAPAWEILAAHLARLGHPDTGTDVILDCGRLATSYPPLHLLAAADLVILVVRATLRAASIAKPTIEATRHGLGETAADRLGLLVVDGGEYRPAEIATALHAPVIATMPWRPSEAAALSDGVGRVAGSSALLRAARDVETSVRQIIDANPRSAQSAAATEATDRTSVPHAAPMRSTPSGQAPPAYAPSVQPPSVHPPSVHPPSVHPPTAQPLGPASGIPAGASR